MCGLSHRFLGSDPVIGWCVFLSTVWGGCRNLRSHPQGPLEDGPPDVSPTVYVSEILSLWGFGEVWGIFPGYVGKIIEENKLSEKCLQVLVSQVCKLFHEFLNVHGVLMGVFVDHTTGCSV